MGPLTLEILRYLLITGSPPHPRMFSMTGYFWDGMEFLIFVTDTGKALESADRDGAYEP